VSRADRLVELLAERELDSLLVTNVVNVRYLTGFSGSNAVCVVGRDARVFITDFRYLTQAEQQVPEEFERVHGKQDLLPEAVERMSGRVGFEDRTMTVHQYARLRELAPEGVELVAAGPLAEELRSVKDEAEIAAIREAAKLADGMLEWVATRGVVGLTERELALELEYEMVRRGATGPSFPSIVAAGPNGSKPHAEPGTRPIGSGELLTIDLGCILDGYCSDCTRTFATGELPDEQGAVYELVLRAQEESLAAVRAGAGGKAVDAVSREIIGEAGHGEHYGHGLGHGVGLEVHEAPRLSPLSEDTLKAGMVVTVEPGVYVPERYGVRIEDLVVVTGDGCDVLSGFPKSLTMIG
jgi:Xaa-Pro aminopeptidase